MKFRRLDRSLHKTLAFAAIHLEIALALGWLFTGSFATAGLLAVLEPAVNTLAHHRLDHWWDTRPPARQGALHKTLLFGAMHLVIGAALGWLLTGSFTLASALAVVEPLANMAAHYLFDRWRASTPGRALPVAA